jgi:hypothetical protein
MSGWPGNLGQPSAQKHPANKVSALLHHLLIAMLSHSIPGPGISNL